jgi:hypothetical protein
MNIEQKQLYAQKIWHNYCDSVKNNWTSKEVKEIGELGVFPRNTIPTSISEKLFDTFDKVVKDNGYKGSLMNAQSFDRILKSGITGSTKTTTLDMFCYFLHKDNFNGYTAKNPLSESEVIVFTKVKRPLWHWGILGVALIGIFIIGKFFFFGNQNKYSSVDDIDEKTKKEVFSFINNAAESEFQTYKVLPKIDTSSLGKYYIPTCDSFWASIIRVTNVHHNLNLVITNPENNSRYKIDSIKISRVNKDTIFVDTKEFWYLRWYSNDSLKYDLKRERMRDFANTYAVLLKNGDKKIVGYKSLVAKRY